MKAAIRTKYGSPAVLSIGEIDTPAPKDDEVLVKVHAASVNRTDCGILWARPFVLRFFTGLSKPKKIVTGSDFAGEVVEAGKDVTRFNVGDKVWGFDDSGLSSHAEFLVIRESKNIISIPPNITFKEAAASAEGAHYARNFINKVDLKAGQKVLVNGADGAIGSALLQMAKYYKTYVTAVGNTKNVELIKSLGADRTIDYLKEDFTQDQEKYDFVFDAVGKSTFSKCKPLLNRGGVYISSELGPNSQNIFFSILTPILGGKKVKFPVPTNIKASLKFIKRLIEEEKFTPIIDRTFPLEKIQEAYKYADSGHKTGNVLISFEDKE